MIGCVSVWGHVFALCDVVCFSRNHLTESYCECIPGITQGPLRCFENGRERQGARARPVTLAKEVSSSPRAHQ